MRRLHPGIASAPMRRCPPIGLALVVLVVRGLWAVVAASVAAAQPDADAQQALADATRVIVELSPDSLTVGDPTTALVRVFTDPSAQVRFAAEQKLGNEVDVRGLEVLPQRIDASTGEGVWEARYAVNVYFLGEKMLPPFLAQVQRDSVAAVVRSDSVFAFVASVLDDSLAAGDILDIKGQQSLRVPWPLWVWIVLGALLVAAIALFVRWRRHHRLPVQVQVEPPKPAHVVALQALMKLETKRLPLDGRIKEHYIELSEILRVYLEEAPPFGIPALEETTDEIVRSLRDRGASSESVQQVQTLCEEADLVKFAKHQPPVDECMEGIERVAAFVRETSRPHPTPPVSDAAVLSALSDATRSSETGARP